MAKKLAAELTPQELEVRHAKSAERRAKRKEDYKDAIKQLVDHLDCKVEELDEVTQRFITVMLGEYKPRQVIVVKEGDDLVTLLDKYRTVKDLDKKILKECEKQGLQLKGTKIVKADGPAPSFELKKVKIVKA